MAGTIAFNSIDLTAPTTGTFSQTITLFLPIPVTVNVTNIAVSTSIGAIPLTPTGTPGRFSWGPVAASVQADLTFEVSAVGNSFGDTASELIDVSLSGEVALAAGDLPLEYTVTAEPITLPLMLETVVDLPIFGMTDITVDGAGTLSALALALTGTSVVLVDGDSDGVPDNADNCVVIANTAQRDTDGDSIGNACDTDISPAVNDCQVNFGDLGVLKNAFFSNPASPNWNPDADFDGDDLVSFSDLGRLKDQFFGPPGPSGLPNACQ